MHNFCVVDLGGFYLDVHQGSPVHHAAPRAVARRSAQTAMFHIAESMVRWLAPILSFTAEEIWRYLPGERARVGVPRDLASSCRRCRPMRIDWEALIELRADVQRELEKLREAGAIGAPLEAEVDVYCLRRRTRALAALGEELRFLLITSDARVHRVRRAAAAGGAGAERRRQRGVDRA